MNLWRDKQIRHFYISLLFLVMLLFLSGIIFYEIQVKTTQNLFLSHDRAVASSLLEQGVSKDVIAKAITNTLSSKEGGEFLVKIGMTEHTKARLLPFIFKFQKTVGYPMLFAGMFLSILLFLIAFFFLWRRERLYQQASQVITNFTEGDFSCHIRQMQEGSIYRLLNLVDQLATKLQSQNETERKTKEFLKNMISDISHQLKTPLAALTLYHEIISDEPHHIEIVKEYSTKTGIALKRMEQLIQSMLKITRLDAGSIVFERRYCNIAELTLKATYELTTRAVNEEKEIIIDGSPEELIACDLQWTIEAIGNIVKNALDHTKQGGKIHITWEATPGMIRIFISDNGTGIDPKDLHHIFKRFYRSENSLDIQGVGLGLPLAKAIVEGQGGIISVQSILNEGTTFILSFLTEL